MEPWERVCPVCGQYTFKEPCDICPCCGWTEDSYQETYTDKGGCANIMSLDEARQAWKDGKPIQ